MSLFSFPVNRFQRFDDPFDRFFGNQLDFFDPWTDFESVLPSALAYSPFRWISEPRRPAIQGQNKNNSGSADRNVPVVPADKFRVQLNVAGFEPNTIKTRVEGRKLIIEAKQGERQADGDYNIREMRKTYEMPEHADTSNLASFITPNHMLVVECPVKNPEKEKRQLQHTQQHEQRQDDRALAQYGAYRDPLFDYWGFGLSDFMPKVVDVSEGQKKLQMSLPMKQYRPEQIKVSVKGRDLIVSGEHEYKDRTRAERSYFTKQVTLPPGTQVDQIQSHLTNDGQLMVEAPFIEATQESLSQQNKDAITHQKK